MSHGFTQPTLVTDPDLTTIAGLTATSDNFMQAKSSAWASRTPTQAAVDIMAVAVQPFFRGSRITSDLTISDSAWDLVEMNSITNDTHSGWHASGSYYTIPTGFGGIWLLEGAAYIQVDAQPTTVYASINVGGNVNAYDARYVNCNSYVLMQTKALLSLTAGSTVGLQLHMEAAGTTSLAYAGDHLTWFSGVRVSA